MIMLENIEKEPKFKTIAELESNLKKHKDVYYKLSEEERNSANGKKLLKLIQNEDKLVKKFDSDIGDYRRNAGNYKF
jgi:hypothetical protein